MEHPTIALYGTVSELRLFPDQHINIFFFDPGRRNKPTMLEVLVKADGTVQLTSDEPLVLKSFAENYPNQGYEKGN